jgi:N-acetylmuramoyl-L-alanine amidase
MRQINYIVLHCTATPQTTTVESILRYWKENLKWKSPGYHHIILPDGTIKNLLPITEISNGVKGYNSVGLHISYIGGVTKAGVAIDNRTEAQKESQILLLKKYHSIFPKAKICGHRDFPGVTKECPSFDVAKWLEQINFFKK